MTWTELMSLVEATLRDIDYDVIQNYEDPTVFMLERDLLRTGKDFLEALKNYTEYMNEG